MSTKRVEAMTRGSLIAALVALAVPVAAQTAQPSVGPNGVLQYPNARVINGGAAARMNAPAISGMRAYRDPETGALAEAGAMAAAELDARMPAAMSKPSPKRLALTERANGLVGVQNDGRFINFSLVRRTPGSALLAACVDDDELVAKLVAQGDPRAESGRADR